MSDDHINSQLLRNIYRQIDELIVESKIQTQMENGVFTFSYGSEVIRFYLPFAGQDGIQSHILRTANFYEEKALRLVAPLLGPTSTVVDAGANIGNHTVYFKKVCNVKHVISFEPIQTTFNILLRNISENQLSGVMPICSALGAHEGGGSISSFRSGKLGTITLEEDALGKLRIASIDSLELPRLDFLKIDVEGGQIDVLRGGEETIKRTRPLIMVEMRAGTDEFVTGDAYLKSIAYKLKMKCSKADYIYEPII